MEHDRIRWIWNFINSGLHGYGIIAFALQIYFDFSGYSDMAIGLAKIFGMDFDENFNYPYISKSITEFWRRWHITLSSWFKDYIYIPLGGNKYGFTKQIRNILIVWFLTGAWHGASWNFILWGLYFGVILILEKLFILKLLDKLGPFISRIYSIVLILIGWVIFAFVDLSNMLVYLKSMFNVGDILLFDNESMFYFNNYFLIILIGIILSTPIVKYFSNKIFRFFNINNYKSINNNIDKFKTDKNNNKDNDKDNITSNNNGYIFNILSIASSFVYIAIFILSTASLVSDSFNPFLYFRF